MISRSLLSASLTLVLAGSASAQMRLVGMIVDTSGSPIPVVSVSAAGETVLSDSRGHFRISVRPATEIALSFRRVGYRPSEVRRQVAEGAGGDIDLGRIVLEEAPIPLDEISVEALAPIMTPRGVRAYEAARREGRARYFFTAYEIERLRLQDVSELARRVPGASRALSPAWGPVVQFLTRGRLCTAVVSVDGVRTNNPNLDLQVTPERVGGIYFDPRECEVSVWTKPVPVGEASPFRAGFRMGAGGEKSSDLDWLLGGFLGVPILAGRGEIYPAFDGGLGASEIRWQVQLTLRFAVPSRKSPAYLGGGVLYSKLDRKTGSRTSALAVGGFNASFGWLSPFAELEASRPIGQGDVRIHLFVGVAYRYEGVRP
jgi:hypothetical protein